jgi:hypothetical protein
MRALLLSLIVIGCSPKGDAKAEECLSEGAAAGKVIAECCPGLIPVPVVNPSTCEQVGAADNVVCARCGDKVCGAYENKCNCADCR